MSQFVLLLRSEDIDFGSYSPEDYQSLLADFDTWNSKLEEKGLHASAGFKGDGKTIRRKAGSIATDGPYCETKEAVTGVCFIEADDHDEALKLAEGCPFLTRGGTVEVRGISQMEIGGKEVGVGDEAACA